MTIIIDSKNQNSISVILDKKVNAENKPRRLSMHFGKLIRNIDGLKYQLLTRADED